MGEPQRTTAAIEAVFPATPLQQGLLYHALLGEDGGVYVTQQVIDLRGAVDVEAFRACWRRVAQRRQILRSSFHWKDTEQPLLVIDRQADLDVAFEDWTPDSATEQQLRLETLLREDKCRGFPLDRAPLLRLTLIRRGAARHWLYWANHHLILDGWSAALLASEVLVAYATGEAGVNGASARRAEWSDYLRWLQRQDQDAARRYWRETLGDLESPCLLDLPPATDSPSERHGRLTRELAPDSTDLVFGLAKRSGVTTAVVALAACAFVLSRYCGSEDVVFGLTSAGRPPELPGVEKIAGLFINTLPLRVRYRTSLTVRDLLREVQRRAAEMRQFEYAPLSLALEQSSIPRGAAAFNVLVVFENYPVDQRLRDGLGGLQVAGIEVHEETNYPLSLIIAPGERLRLDAIHEHSHLSEASVSRFVDACLWTLQQWSVDADRRLDAIAALGFGRKGLVAKQAAHPLPHPLLHRCIEEQARREPDRPAVVDGAAALDYGNLVAAAKRLAAVLRALGAGPDRAVAIAVERGAGALVAILGTLEAGAAYWAPSPTEPSRRLRLIVRQLAPRAIVASPALAGRIPAACPQVLLDAQGELVGEAGGSPSGTAPEPLPGHLAYVLYTSGSTGRPKGVQITHEGLAVSTAARLAYYSEPVSAFLLLSPLSFDSSVAGVFWTLASGGKLVVAGEEERRDPQEIVNLIRRHRVSHLLAVPSLYDAVLEEAARQGCPAPQVAIVAGEACPAGLVKRHFEVWPDTELFNEYGPTEATVWATAHRCSPSEGGPPPIGRPIPSVQALTLDAQGLPAPWGAPAELCLAGATLARGYVGFPSATAAAFRPHPAPQRPGERIYRTGDRVRLRDDGALDFLGRLDRQVKIRGERIELVEIERALTSARGVREAIVEARHDSGQATLVGYVRCEGGNSPPESELLDFLRGRLPAAMVPARLVVFEQFPRNAHGKVDRKRLPPPPARQTTAERPFDPLESRLADCWSAVLGRDARDPDETFFQAGGDSLSLMRLAARIRKGLEAEIALRDLLDAPTIALQAKLLRSRSGGGSRANKYKRADRKQWHALSFAQERLWYLSRLGPAASVAYNIPVCVDLEGDLDVSALEVALTCLVDRHEAFRTRIEIVDEEPRQFVAPAASLRLEILDLSGSSDSEVDAERLARELASRPFDFSQPPLLRAHLLELESKRRRLVLAMPHLIADGWSAAIIFRDLERDYIAQSRGEQASSASPAIQPLDHAVRERRLASRERSEAAAEFWRAKLKGAPPIELPFDRPRPAEKSFRGGSRRVPLQPDLLERLRSFARSNGASLFVVLLSGLRAVLGRLSGQSDFCIGVPVAERSDEGLQDVVGFFVDTAAIRLPTEASASFRQLTAQAGEAVQEALTKPRPPLGRLQRSLGAEPDPSRSSLFQVFFALQDQTFPSKLGDRLRLTPRPLELNSAKFDLTLSVELGEDQALCQWEYDSDLFEAATVDRFAGLFERLLAAALDSPDAAIADLDWMRPEERTVWRLETQGPRPALPTQQGLHQLVSEHASQFPDAAAVWFDGSHWTYRDLEQRANAVARTLCDLGVGLEDRVIVAVERSPEQLAALLGVWKAGAAYVPFDPGDPAERLRFLTADVGASALVRGRRQTEAFRDCGLPMLELGEEEERTELSAPVDASNLAYILYTSGSTGRPKGVAVSHQTILRLLTQSRFANLGPDTRLLVAAPLSFDASTLEIWGALVKGGCCVLAPAQTPSIEALRQAGERGEANTCWLTAALFNLVMDEAPEVLRPFRQVLTGGEALSVPHVRAFRQRHPPEEKRLVNGYGPTECVTFATSHDIETVGESATSIPIGSPIAHTGALVLDARLKPVPTGVVGELYLSGLGLARGYWGRPGLTATAFLPNPFAELSGERMYRTGDLVRRLPGGSLDFVGRVDRQVKIHGRRIELREIEAVIAEQAGVRSCAVVVDERGSTPALIAYVTPRNLSPEELERTALQKLPRYMVPKQFVLLNSLPLTANGKLDRSRLPAAEPVSKPAAGEPASATESLALEMWRELLRDPRLGADDDVFRAGADSLIAIRLCERLFRRGFHLDLTEVFRRPTARGQAGVLRPVVSAQRSLSPLSGEAPLSPSQRMFFSLRHDNPHQYNIAQWFRVRGELQQEALAEVAQALESRHDALRLRFDVAAERAWIKEHPAAPPIEWNALQAVAGTPQRAELEAAAERLQESLRIDTGPLYRLAWFQSPGADVGFLFAVVHHLAADGASMWILYADLALALEQVFAGAAIRLPPPPVLSWGAWSERLRIEAAKQELSSWAERWQGARPRPAFSLQDATAPPHRNLQRYERTVARVLDQDFPAVVQNGASRRGWSLPHLLGVAAANGVAAVFGRTGVTMDWLSHGRDPVLAGLDASNTVGYFTARTPVVLKAAPPRQAADAIESLRAQIEQPPYGSLGFGLARYLAPAPLAVPHGDMSFNFVGRLDYLRGTTGTVGLEAGLSSGTGRDGGQQRVGLIHVFADLENDQLRFVWRYSSALHQAKQIEAAADAAIRWLADAARG